MRKAGPTIDLSCAKSGHHPNNIEKGKKHGEIEIQCTFHSLKIHQPEQAAFQTFAVTTTRLLKPP